MLLVTVAYFGLSLTQANAVTAYLNGSIDKEIYMGQPEGFVNAAQPHKVCKLLKAVYGLKQSGDQWFVLLRKHLTEIGFLPTFNNKCLYVQSNAMVAVYVDNFLLISRVTAICDKVLNELAARFKLKQLGKPTKVPGHGSQP